MKEVLELALDALTYIYTETTADEDELIDQAITALRLAIDVQNMASESTYKAALAQPTSGDYALGYAEGFNDACKPAQPAQEPVAWLTKNKFSGKVDLDAKNAKETTGWSAAFPVYTTPQQRPWVGLTPDERYECIHGESVDAWDIAEAVEAKLKEKNT